MKLNELKAELKEIEKELKNSIRSCWSLKVEKFDRDNGEEYQVWSQIFDTEEQLDKFVEQNKEWKKMDTIDIPMYDISKRFIPEIHSHNESELKAKIEYLKKGISACEEILNSQQNKNLISKPSSLVNEPQRFSSNKQNVTGSADTLRGLEDGE